MTFIYLNLSSYLGFPGGSDGKKSTCSVGDLGSMLGLRRDPGEGNSNPLQYSGLENPMDRGAWQATVHGVAESWTRLSDSTTTHHRQKQSKLKNALSVVCWTRTQANSSVSQRACRTKQFSFCSVWVSLFCPGLSSEKNRAF